jgi:two-component system KDP operon response regulator KdpE
MVRKLVLAIEHDWRLRRLIQANLEAYGLQVRGAVNGRHSLHLLGKHQPDLILVDTDLPDMEVAHLLERLKTELGEQVPIIVLSSEPPGRHLRQNGHRIWYLLKPFAAAALLEQVWQALEDVTADAGQTATDG